MWNSVNVKNWIISLWNLILSCTSTNEVISSSISHSLNRRFFKHVKPRSWIRSFQSPQTACMSSYDAQLAPWKVFCLCQVLVIQVKPWKLDYLSLESSIDNYNPSCTFTRTYISQLSNNILLKFLEYIWQAGLKINYYV